MSKYSSEDSFIANYYDEYANIDRSGVWAFDVANVVENAGAGENVTIHNLGSVAGPQKLEGELKIQAMANYKITIKNDVYANGFVIPKADYLRNPEAFNNEARSQAGKHVDHFNVLGVDLITGSSTNTFDGLAYFSASHSRPATATVSATTQTNLLSSSDIASLNVSTAAAPTATEAVKFCLETVGYMQSFVDESGDPSNSNARGFKAVTSNPLIAASLQTAFSANNLTGGETNTLIASNLSMSVAQDPRLGAIDSTVFYLFRTDDPSAKGLVMVEEFAPEAIFEYDAEKVGYVFTNTGTRSAGYGRWQSGVKCTLS